MDFHKVDTRNLKWLEKHQKFLKIFDDEGYEVRFVGGAVKNSFINQDVNDFDIATNASPESVMAILKKNNIKTIPTGLKHGTVTAINNGIAYEITTLRKDVETYGRHAKIEFTDDWKEDAARRDFTMNAIFVDRHGKIYDFFNGLEDLEKGIVRFIGNAEERIQEDYLRILRYFRFFALYGNQNAVDKNSIEGCRKYKDQIKNLSTERITKEILILLNYHNSLTSIKLMLETGVLNVIFCKNIDLKHLESFFLLDINTEIKNISILKLLLLLSFDTNSCELSLSNAQKQLMKNLSQIYSEESFINIKNLFEMVVKKDIKSKDFLNVIKYLYNDDWKLVVLLLSVLYKCDGSFAKEIIEMDLPRLEFPVASQDIMSLGYTGKDIGEKLSQAKKYWLNNLCNVSKLECIKYIS